MTRSTAIRGKTKNRESHREAAVTTTSRVHETRRARGLGATELARRAGVSRQTIYAIESGDFVPNTSVALHLARVLEVSVEDLFSVGADTSDPSPDNISAELLAMEGEDHPAGELVRVAKVGSRTIAAPALRYPAFLPEADGAIARRNKKCTGIRFATESVRNGNNLVVAGCDPALSMLASELKAAGTEVISVHCSSQQALSWLKKGLVHVAGTHMRDRSTGEYNLPLVTSLFGKENVRVVTFAEWEQGLVVQRGNPKRIRSVADLANRQIRIVNREKGSGARDLLDCNLRDAGIQPQRISGYARIVPSHLAAALAVANAQADCAVATVSAAKCSGLDFVPLSKERFDLIVASSEMDTVGVTVLFDALNRATLRRKLAMLAGYEVRRTGNVLM
jgi:molybdate-binding protein/DNA-binding XRE family transcriptional regulator